MPLVVLSGYPSCGKTRRAEDLRDRLRAVGHAVHFTGDEDVGVDRNVCYADSTREKAVRGSLKAAAERHISKDNVVIIDSPNYIKGFRYELYCVARQHKTTHCVIYCAASDDQCREWNSTRPESSRYTDDIFSGLVRRFEEPDSRSRWDSPLFTILPEDEVPFDEICAALFERKAPRPNQSTQTQPLSSASFLHDIDRMTQNVNLAILSAQRSAVPGEAIVVPGSSVKVEPVGMLTMSELRRMRNQFISYTKLHPVQEPAQMAMLYVEYLNNTIK